MTNAQTDADWRADQDTDSYLARAAPLLEVLADRYGREKLGAELKETAQKLREERVRIVRRWD